MRLTGIVAAALLVVSASGPFPGVLAAPPLPFTSRSEAEGRIRREVRTAERVEMVRPAPKGFKPEPEPRKLKLTLIARDKTIREEESLWYRLELQNIGREPATFREEPSFLKDGGLYSGGDWGFYLLRPNGKKERILPGRLADTFRSRERPRPPIDVPGSEKMSAEEVREWVWRDGTRRAAERDLEVVLAPGETLVSRPWRWVEPEEQHELYAKGESNLWPRPVGEFRELRTSAYWEPLGRFTLWVVYDNPPLSADEDEMRRLQKRGISRAETLEDYRRINSRRLGRLESNPVVFEVVP